MADQLERLQDALRGRYRIDREIGRGGMATVYVADDLKNRRRVAVKLLRQEVGSAIGPERFLREIEIAARLNHPHVLALHDSGDIEGVPFYVMPFVEGDTLRQRLDRERQLPLEEVLRIAQEVGDALSYAHGVGILHRDIKPENILFQAQHALVSDFGIARAISASATERLTRTGIAVGTPAYMSPEQAAGDDNLDGRSDLYSLACVVYEMLAGQPPFTGSNAQAIIARHAVDTVPPLRTVRSVPQRVERVITKALQKVPADRFRSVREFVRGLWTPEVVAPRGAPGPGSVSGTPPIAIADIRTPKPRSEDLDAFAMTHPAKVGSTSQDHFLIYSLQRRILSHVSSLPGNHAAALEAERLAYVAMVADGIGKGSGADVASQMAMEIITEYIARSVHCCYTADLEDEHTFAATLKHAAERLHSEFVQTQSADPVPQPSLTLWIGVWPRAYILQLGTSCCFVLRNGILTRLTGPAQVESTASAQQSWMPTVTKMEQHWGDVGLLCTDGLTANVPAERICHCLTTIESAKEGCERLIQEAIDAGGTDDVTVLIGRSLPNRGEGAS